MKPTRAKVAEGDEGRRWKKVSPKRAPTARETKKGTMTERWWSRERSGKTAIMEIKLIEKTEIRERRLAVMKLILTKI